MFNLLGRKYPGKIAQPTTPFAIAGLIMLYAVNAGANAMAQAEPYKSDPRNPNLGKKEH
ncbi:mitochondrial F1F0 ATP synthase subunit Atp18 [Ascosphaera apis ARSEF 7405]|uniref:Mitochondrial F1F0 ATP synthase subunit Atp18 n=1 Tax=Ascosphaera apis ARSEF 7405 TaxID=392613 RepID=A0A167V0K7_9EURO|nr:mitochondrial F1F0 ATP synthase subunit Atp18 [Ascosphaera apis ARSEF 7405]